MGSVFHTFLLSSLLVHLTVTHNSYRFFSKFVFPIMRQFQSINFKLIDSFFCLIKSAIEAPTGILRFLLSLYAPSVRTSPSIYKYGPPSHHKNDRRVKIMEKRVFYENCKQAKCQKRCIWLRGPAFKTVSFTKQKNHHESLALARKAAITWLSISPW